MVFDGVEYHLSHGDWIAILGKHGFSVLALHELTAGEDAQDPGPTTSPITVGASRWPAEDLCGPTVVIPSPGHNAYARWRRTILKCAPGRRPGQVHRRAAGRLCGGPPDARKV